MGKIAFLFAGQGSQYPGMGKDFFENISEVHDFFGVAEAIRPGTLNQMFSGSEEELKQTKNTQPCLFLADIAPAIALIQNNIKPDAVAGFSLGEVVAMGVSGAMPYADAFKLVVKRGELMQKASETVKGKMLAVLKMDTKEIEEDCQKEGVFPVNYNCPGQVVVSGSEENIENFKKRLSEKKARCIELAVGGAFHTPYMKKAGDELKKEMAPDIMPNINKPEMPVYANKTARPYPSEREDITTTLSEQISNSVKWEETLLNMASDGVDTFIECGPGTTLSGFVKRTLKDVKILNVSDIESLEKVTKELKS